MINRKYFRYIAVTVAAAALLFQVQPAIAAEDAPTVTDETAVETETQEGTAEKAQEQEATPAETETEPEENDPIEIPSVEIDPIEIHIPDMGEQSEETAKPEENTSEQEGQEVQSVESSETPVKAEEAQTETTEYKTDFAFENEEVKITATASQEAKLPLNTEMKAVKLQEGTAAYESAKAASAQTLGTDDEAQYCFYDVTFTVDGQEIKPTKGTVMIQMEFKNIQVDAEAQTQNIVHIEDAADGGQVQDVTSVSENGSNLKSVDFTM